MSYGYYGYSATQQVPFRTQFDKFNNAIRLGTYEENATLREKRDRVLRKLGSNCSVKFSWFNQGSYQMRTGVVPLDGDYDIDIGIVFDLEVNQYSAPNPITVKKWVLDALQGHTKDVAMRRPCVRVAYQQYGEPVYHVDLAVYARSRFGTIHLAKGLQFSPATAEWQPSDPQGAMDKLMKRFSGDEAAQFRRVVRYLKRWKNYQFSSDGNAAPVGIGLTIAAYQLFNPTRTGNAYDDFSALRKLVTAIKAGFAMRWVGNGYVWRMEAKMPAEPYDDVFLRMTDNQMSDFKSRVDQLDALLSQAQSSGSATSLRRAFGDDFPV